MSTEPLVVISSDGHVGAVMAGYRDFIDAKFRDDFDRFLTFFEQHGLRTSDPQSLRDRLDPDSLEEWSRVMETDRRWERFIDPDRRLDEAESEGVAAEVLFPDTGGVPFQLSGITASIAMAQAGIKNSFEDAALQAEGRRAYNRWLVEFVQEAPDRFFGQAIVSWQDDVESVISDIRWARDHGLRGIILPKFSVHKPLFHPDFEPIWNVVDELGMIVNCHTSISSTSDQIIPPSGAPHPACTIRVGMPEHIFYTRNMLSHLIWGGVLERHPSVNFVFTEQGSGWVTRELESMDYSYTGSYFRTDYHDVIRCKPSEYFRRQCYLGSSILSRAEIAERHEIGMDKMMVGMDLPHHEGMLIQSVREYLRATLGAEAVPLDEARRLLGANAAEVFGFDLSRLAPVADRIALGAEEVLAPPERDLYPRGDIKKPAAALLSG